MANYLALATGKLWNISIRYLHTYYAGLMINIYLCSFTYEETLKIHVALNFAVSIQITRFFLA